MKLLNKTLYDGHYLRRLFLECEKHIFAVYLKHAEEPGRQIVVEYHKGKNNHGVRGHAWYHSRTIHIQLPRPRKEFGSTGLKVSARDVATTYLHEVGHNMGLRHKQMGKWWNIDTSWWPDEITPLKAIKQKPKQNIIEFRAAKAQRKLDEWKSKVKRANKLVKKYSDKVRYYEKKMSAFN